MLVTIHQPNFMPWYPFFQKMEEADIKETKPARKSGSTVYVDRAPTVRLDTAITMYMPPSVKVSYGANYSDQEIGEKHTHQAEVVITAGSF